MLKVLNRPALACVIVGLLRGAHAIADAPETPLARVEGRRVGHLVFFEVRVNGQGPFWFCVDTGARHTIIDASLARELGLEVVKKGTTGGTGESEVPIETAKPLAVDLGSLKLRVLEPWVIDMSQVPIPRWTRGLVGAEFFESFVVELDPETPSLTFYAPEAYRKLPQSTALPLTLDDHRLFIPATIDANEKKSVQRQLRVDTGSEDSVADEVMKDGFNVRKTVLGHGLGKDYEGVSGQVLAVHLGPFAFTRVWGPAVPRPTIGMELLFRFTLIFDAPHGLLHVVPNSHLADPIPAPGSEGVPRD